jgi:hypothetical protein
MLYRFACTTLLTFVCAAPALAKPHEAKIPLHDGKLRTADLTEMLSRELHLPAKLSVSCGDIDLRGLRGSLVVAALNKSLGDGCSVSVADDSLVLHVDPEKLPENCRSAEKAARVFTTIVAPEATAKQQSHYGLFVPEKIDTTRPLVVLIHGLDCDRLNWSPMMELLSKEGRQVALFSYPSDQPIDDSAKLLGEKLAQLRLETPGLMYDLICHSMGGLVARDYVEGEGYRGGVNRLIMLGTPNRGTNWASYRFALEVEEHYKLWRQDPDWSPSWMITDGLGEAGADL